MPVIDSRFIDALSQSLAYDCAMSDSGKPDQAELAPSSWVVRFAPLVPSGGRVLDVACGNGRHALFFAARGHHVDAVDRDPSRIDHAASSISVVQADIEVGAWPFEGEKFAGVVVTNYLHRPLLPKLVAAVAHGGVLIYETFAAGNERYGRPSRPDFLLQPGELLECVRGQLQVLAFEDIYVESPKPARVQRIAAARALL